jgi:hypothetical protein
VAKRGPAGQDGDEPRDAGPGAAGDDLVAAAADELYSADPGEFTDRRKALADAARAAGDAAAAKRIAALRKPTRAAWVVNQLARADPDAPDRLAELAAALRSAEEAKDGPRLRELSAARGPLVDSLTAQALAAAGVADPPSGLREEVSETLTSAIGDPTVAADFAAGTLTRAAQWAGFGLASFGETPFGTASDETGADEAPKPPAKRHLRAVPSPELSASAPAPARTGSRRAVAGRVSEEEQARRARAEEQRLAEEAAQRAAERRQAFEDAERTVASTAAAAAEADAAEDQLEAEVRDLEQRLTQAREDLAAARMRARRAESAERRARQTLDRLPRPE